MNDTIVALATAPLHSAIGVIRLSGPEAVDIAAKVFSCSRPLSELPCRHVTLGKLRDSEGRLIDDCLINIARGPASYTGEDTVEFSCHGSVLALSEAIAALIEAGARQALPGEYTKRAFLNGKMDLSQAEAVIDLISAETAEAARNAAGQVSGAISRLVSGIYDELVDICSHYYAVVDYTDEDIEPFESAEFLKTLISAQTQMEKLLETYGRGRVLKEGVKSAIIGRPNVGKSSLLNALTGTDRAIVTPIAGTTRDTIEESVRVGGLVLRLSDTAGIRSSADPVEKIGISKAQEAARSSELVLLVIDGSSPLEAEDFEAIRAAEGAKHLIALVNKSDLELRVDIEEIKRLIPAVCIVSAKEQDGLEALDREVERVFGAHTPTSSEGGILTNARQAAAVRQALNSLVCARSALESGLTADAVLSDVELALDALGDINGKTAGEDVVHRIFERFCVGK